MRAKRPFLFQVDSSTWVVRLAAALPLAMVAAAILAACGGAQPVRTSSEAPREKPAVVQPLLDDEGNATAADPAAVAAIAALGVPANGRYATPAQVELMVEALGPGAVEITLNCCNDRDGEIGQLSMWIDEVASGLPPSTAIFVRASDLRLAALAANRIASGGLANVWMVTP